MEKMFCRIDGDGEPVVLVHGFCEDMRVWDEVAPALEKQYKVVKVDLPGFGRTKLTAGELPETLEDMALRLHYNLQNQGITRCTMIGHSMGGYVTLAFAEKYPEMLNGLGLFQSTAYPDTEEKKVDRMKQVEFVKNNGVEAYANVTTPNLFAKADTKIRHEAAFQKTLALGRQCSAEGIINALLAMRLRPERIEILKTIDLPVLIVAGADDGVIPIEKLSYQASLPARCLFEVLEQSGHVGMLEEPEKSIEILQKFMEFVVS